MYRDKKEETLAGTPQGGIVTPPTTLQTFFCRLGLCRTLVDPKDHMALVLCHFDSLHQGTNPLTFARPVCSSKPALALSRKVLQASHDPL